MGDSKSDWVARVLGVSAASGGGGRVDWPAIGAAWRSASDEADQQIAALQAALRSSDDEVLEEIAEFGLNGLTGNFKTPLMAALMDIERGDPAVIAKTGPKLLTIVQQFRAHLDGSEKIDVCDDNPFGVAVSLRATLGGALAQMEQALQRAA